MKSFMFYESDILSVSVTMLRPTINKSYESYFGACLGQSICLSVQLCCQFSVWMQGGIKYSSELAYKNISWLPIFMYH